MSNVYVLQKQDTFVAVDGSGTVGFGFSAEEAKAHELAKPISIGQGIFTSFATWSWVPQSPDETRPFFLGAA